MLAYHGPPHVGQQQIGSRVSVECHCRRTEIVTANSYLVEMFRFHRAANTLGWVMLCTFEVIHWKVSSENWVFFQFRECPAPNSFKSVQAGKNSAKCVTGIKVSINCALIGACSHQRTLICVRKYIQSTVTDLGFYTNVENTKQISWWSDWSLPVI